ncbi:aspartic peptidase domain-containing protein [Chytriomyces sp. MP71]|nr:aspartic peptidase domain-containing protein [Chytriomyces sp. MP71]
MKKRCYPYNLKLDKRDAPLTDCSNVLYTTSVTFGNGQPSPRTSTRAAVACGTTTWKVGYGDGSGASGYVCRGPVSLGGVKATINFGVTTAENGMTAPNEGLWGLAYLSLNDISGGNYVQAAGFTSLAFYFSDSSEGDKGELTLNGVDNSKFSGSLACIPITSQTYYQFNPSGSTFSINGKAICVSDNSAIADSGTTLLFGPKAVTDKMLPSAPELITPTAVSTLLIVVSSRWVLLFSSSCKMLISTSRPNTRIAASGLYRPCTEYTDPLFPKPRLRTTVVSTKVVATSARAGTTIKPKCNQSECASGAFLRATCNDYAASVCAADDYCCSNAWDSHCVR